MMDDDVQYPEFIINGMGHDGKIRKVPHLYQREGETWDQFCERMRRVSNSLNIEHHPASKPTLRISNLTIGIILGLAMWLAIWRFVL